MERPAANSNKVCFGLFEADLDARVLRKSGVKIKLNEQPFQVLALLLERPGELVSREELQARLWPSDTFVDFDVSLNGAVKRLRQALGDESDNPRFIETLYRRGYRFIAPVSTPPSERAPRADTTNRPASLHHPYWGPLRIMAMEPVPCRHSPSEKLASTADLGIPCRRFSGGAARSASSSQGR